VEPQSDAAVNGVVDRLRAQRAVDKDVGEPAFGDTEAEPAAIFDPVLVADGRRNDAVAVTVATMPERFANVCTKAPFGALVT
jgi:hypothetical protein